MGKIRYVQDGRNFYCEISFIKETVVVEYRDKVKDFDMEGAGLARAWFLKWCEYHNFKPVED